MFAIVLTVEGHADCARSIDSHGSSRFDVAKRLSYTSISSNYSDDLEIQKVIEDETSEVGRVCSSSKCLP